MPGRATRKEYAERIEYARRLRLMGGTPYRIASALMARYDIGRRMANDYVSRALGEITTDGIYDLAQARLDEILEDRHEDKRIVLAAAKVAIDHYERKNIPQKVASTTDITMNIEKMRKLGILKDIVEEVNGGK